MEQKITLLSTYSLPLGWMSSSVVTGSDMIQITAYLITEKNIQKFRAISLIFSVDGMWSDSRSGKTFGKIFSWNKMENSWQRFRIYTCITMKRFIVKTDEKTIKKTHLVHLRTGLHSRLLFASSTSLPIVLPSISIRPLIEDNETNFNEEKEGNRWEGGGGNGPSLRRTTS